MENLREKVISLLTDAFPPPARVELQEGEEIIGVLVSERFEWINSVERHAIVWDILDKALDPEERQQILTVVAVTPVEYIGATSSGV